MQMTNITYQVVINDTPALDLMAVGPTYIGFERYSHHPLYLFCSTTADLESDVVREWHNEWIRLNEELLDAIVIEAPDVCRLVLLVGYRLTSVAVPQSHLHWPGL
jgi:hypothetical protein